jgi:hypothetical protein
MFVFSSWNPVIRCCFCSSSYRVCVVSTNVLLCPITDIQMNGQQCQMMFYSLHLPLVSSVEEHESNILSSRDLVFDFD